MDAKKLAQLKADAFFVRNMLSAIYQNEPSMDRKKALEAAERINNTLMDEEATPSNMK